MPDIGLSLVLKDTGVVNGTPRPNIVNDSIVNSIDRVARVRRMSLHGDVLSRNPVQSPWVAR